MQDEPGNHPDIQTTHRATPMGLNNDDNTLLNLLKKPPIDATFEAHDLNVLRSMPVSTRHYSPHTIISRQGDWTNSVLIINSGWCCIYRDLPNGDRQILDFPMKGDLLGFRTGLGFNYYTLFSITDISVLEINLDTLVENMLKSARLAMAFMEMTARQRTILLEHLISLGRRASVSRVAHLLLELGYRARANGTGDENGFYCPITQSELADALGLTPIHINRMLRELREDNLLTFRNNEVKFLNRTALMQICSFDESYLAANIFASIHKTNR